MEFPVGMAIVFGLIGLIVSVVAIIAMCQIFTKAGQPGWAAIVPFYSIYILLPFIGYPILAFGDARYLGPAALAGNQYGGWPQGPYGQQPPPQGPYGQQPPGPYGSAAAPGPVRPASARPVRKLVGASTV